MHCIRAKTLKSMRRARMLDRFKAALCFENIMVV